MNIFRKKRKNENEKVLFFFIQKFLIIYNIPDTYNFYWKNRNSFETYYCIKENISLIAQILIITNNKKIIKNDTWRNCKAKFINYLPVAIPRISSNTSPVTGLEKNILKNLKKRETS
ncbi:hypothetical protein RCL_jg23747.t1 [Rhizophagus clarus]|uniref:Uncharacterized protein n=1 Tax=Rhizophagus clarus TaxID=94130 RepID=A0A8H3QR79_9GLOM|nr:hypothetical protein RCL_jg23747.t1 [Rhizophagus clarus]